MARVSVLGAGGWGIAVANLLAGLDNQVILWKHDPGAVRRLIETRRDDSKLRGVTIHPEIKITHQLEEALVDRDAVVMAVPAQNLRHLCERIAAVGRPLRLVVILSKGIEVASLKRMSQVAADELGDEILERLAVISGPSHAEEVSSGVPTSVVVAAPSHAIRSEVQHLFSSPTFRVYTSEDVVGVELGGALKNVIALAAGIIQGLRLGDNTTGALLTRGLAEMTRLGAKMGAVAETFAGLSGLGDLVTTCISPYSRNRTVGERIGRGEKLSDILSSMTMVAEGVPTTRAAVRLADKFEADMPITRQVYAVLFESKPPAQALGELMTRELKSEVYC